jgi:galactokinase
VSTPEVDALVRLLETRPGVHGARIVGGGFGGAVLAIADREAAAAAARDACAAYVAETGQDGRVLLPL